MQGLSAPLQCHEKAAQKATYWDFHCMESCAITERRPRMGSYFYNMPRVSELTTDKSFPLRESLSVNLSASKGFMYCPLETLQQCVGCSTFCSLSFSLSVFLTLSCPCYFSPALTVSWFFSPVCLSVSVPCSLSVCLSLLLKVETWAGSCNYGSNQRISSKPRSCLHLPDPHPAMRPPSLRGLAIPIRCGSVVVNVAAGDTSGPCQRQQCPTWQNNGKRSTLNLYSLWEWKNTVEFSPKAMNWPAEDHDGIKGPFAAMPATCSYVIL